MTACCTIGYDLVASFRMLIWVCMPPPTWLLLHPQGVNLAKRFALVPLGPPLTSYKSNCRAMLKANAGHVELEVDRDYHTGEPIVAWYVPHPSSQQMSKVVKGCAYVSRGDNKAVCLLWPVLE